jgi:hypothetical protein
MKLKTARSVALILAFTSATGLLPGAALHAQTCANPVACENELPGIPQADWDIAGDGDATIQGFADDISFRPGDMARFKVSTDAAGFTVSIYRLGFYQGSGARLVETIDSEATLPQTQPDCLTEPTTGLVDCGNWTVSASWAIPTTAVSGVYFARATREDTGGSSHIVFVVRDDARSSDLLFQTSDTTWQAYNSYGGSSLYVGGPGTNPARAYKLSYNRPFNTRAVKPESWLFNAEYPMVRWLEANGYDVSYTSGLDTDRGGAAALLTHRVFLSVGHDEYWSGQQRANVEAARAAGVHLAFFSGNEIFWKTRWENSIDGSNTPYRTLVSYKETHASAAIDPADPPAWTGAWRDPRFSPPGDGGRAENALAGPMFAVNGPDYHPLNVPASAAGVRFWRNTAVAALESGQSLTISAGCSCLIGYEWDVDADNGFRPPGLIDLSSSTYSIGQLLQDYGHTFAPGMATHSLTLYRYTSGALVFGAGTVGFSWGLDGHHDVIASSPDLALQQATVNLLADMGVQPATLQPGLVTATASVDTTPPISTITSPAPGATLQPGAAITIAGTARDEGGGTVAGLEVSVDGGGSWHPASGTTSWTYTWTPVSSNQVTIRSRAVDDSGNLETPSAGVTSAGAPSASCPCSIWPTSARPVEPSRDDANPVEVGIKFQADVAGWVTAVRFFKGPGNTGSHVGNLWTSAGALLASAAFANETAGGWQQASFPNPVLIAANTTYVASYHANNGHYARDAGYLASTGVDNAPLHVPASPASGGNGVYVYGATSAFPTNTSNASNYWVDVVFTSQ